ncbi:hypothetical protein Taro_053940 [Colocasia esculenta]|uniref:Uncharacterized protein n=1 Tax=Colocasia esculenta TaxID=4460 RepID=A0A843XP86_COLES|nr:hypothetical protein [Colocasia esculenta]
MYFHEVEERTWMEVVKVNLEGPTAVIRAVLPAMRKRRRGVVVNVGSASAGVLPSFPFFSTYAATKAYLTVLSRSLDLEYKNSGISVQCQVPLTVATKIIDGLMPNLYYWILASTADTYARASVRWIGYDPWCIPCWQHFIQGYLVRLVPESLMDLWLATIICSKRV